MKEGTSKLLKTYYFVVTQILKKCGENTKKGKLRAHSAFKSFFNQQYGTRHKSLKNFEKHELSELINRLLIEFSAEYGIFLLQPGDPENAETFSLSEYLEYKNWDMESNYDSFNGIKTLPDGFAPIEDINALKRLKKRKKTRRPENMEMDYGKELYVHSYREGLYYKKELTPLAPIGKIEEYIKKRLLYGTHKPKPTVE